MHDAKRPGDDSNEPLALCMSLCCLALMISADSAMAAEFRRVGKRPATLTALRSSVQGIAEPTPQLLGNATARSLGLDAKSSLELKLERALPQGLGRTLRFVQVYNGIPIWNAEVVVQKDPTGSVVDVDGAAVFGIGTLDLAVPPALQPAEALEIANTKTRGSSVAPGPQGKDLTFENEQASLVYYLDGTGTLRLSYHTSFLAHDADGIPTRPVFAYAAEEVGLRGLLEVARDYDEEGKNVIAALQMDMTGYAGSPKNLYLITDYVSPDLNAFIEALIAEYNGPGAHEITYGETKCGYACAYHVAWTGIGVAAAFPFEAAFEDYNPRIHSANDTESNLAANGAHPARFAKLGVEFMMELGKSAESAP